MTTYSQSDLATRALQKAGLVAAEETPSAADLSFAQEGIASDTAALALEGIVIDNGSDQSVPLEHLEPRAEYHAVTLQSDFGMMSIAQAEQARAILRPRLYRLCANPTNGSVAEADYY